jgi:peptidoglycan hydrolase CwlO-like protein
MKNIFIKLEDRKKDDVEQLAFIKKTYNHAEAILDKKYKSVEDENTQLKKEVEHYKKMLNISEERIVSLVDQLTKNLAMLKTINDFYKGGGECGLNSKRRSNLYS